MSALTATIDGAFFGRDEVGALNGLLEWQATRAVALFASSQPYDASHQADRFVDVAPQLRSMSPLQSLGHELGDAETTTVTIRFRTDGSTYKARFSKQTFEQGNLFSRQLYGRGLWRLKPYEEYRVLTLLEHREAGPSWFVTCDTKRLLGSHCQEVLARYSINACPPSALLRSILEANG